MTDVEILYLYCFAPTVIALLLMAGAVAVRWRPISGGPQRDFRVERWANAWELLNAFNPGYEGMLYLLSPSERADQEKTEINPEAIRK